MIRERVVSSVCLCAQGKVQERASELVSNSITFQQMVNVKIAPNRSSLKADSKIDMNMKELIANARGEFGYGNIHHAGLT